MLRYTTMSAEKPLAMRTTALLSVATLILGLLIGTFAIAPLALPPTEKVVEKPVEKVVEKVVEKPVPPLRGEYLIGALLPLTGDLASYGENSREAIKLAESEINSFLAKSGATFTIKVVIEDTQTKPDVALQKLQSLAAKGVKLYVGPQTSAEIRQIKSYADANKLLLVSQSSTAPDLAIPGDYVFRFCPDDTIQGPIGPRLAKTLGLTHIIYIWRGDAWGDGLYRASSDEAKKLGLTVITGPRYAPEKKEFSAEAKALADEVQKLVNQGVKPEKIMVEYIAFAEAVPFFVAVADYPVLKQVKWFGSDGTAQLSELLAEPKAAEFAVQTKWLNPIFAATSSDKFVKVRDAVKAKLGREPDSYAYAAYDAVWVLTLALIQAGKYDGEAVRSVLPDVARNYFGAVGWINLNAAGDLAFADYILWVVQKREGKYVWVDVGTYSFATGTFTWKDGFTP
jgi:branched-chain amino acid transport system substrate-binding protein